ncbi:MAG: hypothetical protein ACOVQ4_15030 [Flectobacillus sp.]|uniref:hypothetical protein n=1 Tax=Flectobacillus sp. TaxID=50419 RepID=UPI003B997792
MKFFIKHIAILLSVVIVLLGCDEIKKDVVPVTPVGTQTALWDIHTLYTSPSNMVTINVKDFLKNLTGHAITIEKNGSYGKAYFTLSGKFIVYMPDSTVSDATDMLILNVINKDTQKQIKDSIWVKITNDWGKVPCNAGVMPDWFQCINKGGECVLDVLKNDRYCNAILDSSSLEVALNPLFGSAVVKNNRIVYTPQKDYDGPDLLFYRVCSAGTQGICMTAAVKLDVEGSSVRPCITSLLPNYYGIPSNIPKVQLDILANDNLCSTYNASTLKITKLPKYGTASVSNGKIDYEPIAASFPSYFTQIDDYLEYTLSDKYGVASPGVWVKISLIRATDCDVKFDNGVMEVSETIVQATPFEIPYQLYLSSCAEISSVSVTEQGSHGTAYVKGTKIYYQISAWDKDKGKDRDDQIKIKVTTTQGKELSANFKIKIKK